MLIFEWKGIAHYLERKHGFVVPVRTIQYWHEKFMPIPFDKTSPGRGGKVRVPAVTLDRWIALLAGNFPWLYKVKRAVMARR